MKTILRKVVLILMAAAMSFSFISCMNQLDRSNASEIEDLLSKKYGEQFEVISVGDRLGSDRADTVTAYCRPKGKTAPVFEAEMSASRELISDGYPRRALEAQASGKLREKLAGSGFEALCAVSVFGTGEIDPDSISFEQVLSSGRSVRCGFTVCVRELSDPQGLYDAVAAFLLEIREISSSAAAGCTVYSYSSQSYDQLSDKILSQPWLSDSEYEGLSPSASASVSLSGDAVTPKAEEFCRTFRAE